jgi:replication factor A1
VPQVKFSFVELSQLENVAKDSLCDVIGVVKEVGDLSEITSKATQKQVGVPRPTINLLAQTSLTLFWGKDHKT